MASGWYTDCADSKSYVHDRPEMLGAELWSFMLGGSSEARVDRSDGA